MESKLSYQHYCFQVCGNLYIVCETYQINIGLISLEFKKSQNSSSGSPDVTDIQ